MISSGTLHRPVTPARRTLSRSWTLMWITTKLRGCSSRLSETILISTSWTCPIVIKFRLFLYTHILQTMKILTVWSGLSANFLSTQYWNCGFFSASYLGSRHMSLAFCTRWAHLTSKKEFIKNDIPEISFMCLLFANAITSKFGSRAQDY